MSDWIEVTLIGGAKMLFPHTAILGIGPSTYPYEEYKGKQAVHTLKMEYPVEETYEQIKALLGIL